VGKLGERAERKQSSPRAPKIATIPEQLEGGSRNTTGNLKGVHVSCLVAKLAIAGFAFIIMDSWRSNSGRGAATLIDWARGSNLWELMIPLLSGKGNCSAIYYSHGDKFPFNSVVLLEIWRGERL
jgi:hypothetical protein